MVTLFLVNKMGLRFIKVCLFVSVRLLGSIWFTFLKVNIVLNVNRELYIQYLLKLYQANLQQGIEAHSFNIVDLISYLELILLI